MIIVDRVTARQTFRTPLWLDRSFVIPARRPLRPLPGFVRPPTAELCARLARARSAVAPSAW